MPMLVVLYLLAAIGLAYIAGHSLVSKHLREIAWDFAETFFPPLRWLVLLVECPACFGFWIGLVAGVCGAVPFALHRQIVLSALAWALATSGWNFIVGKLTGLMPEPVPTDDNPQSEV